jgi:SAM-dependent methyltransferase
MSSTPGIDGYAAEADRLAVQYEGLDFAVMHRAVLPLLPPPPARVCDIGAGTGRDAAALARLGHSVVAVEPTAEMRAHGRRLHADAAIDWVDDGLPDLAVLQARGDRFDLVMLVAVLMHLDVAERRRAMAAIAGVMAPGGLLVLTLRHGPVPPGRRMFEVPAAEVIGLGAGHGLALAHAGGNGDVLGRDGVSWSVLALRRPA